MSFNIFSAWSAFVKRRPVVVNSFTGGSLCAASDGLAQYLEEQRLVMNGDDNDARNNEERPTTPASRSRRLLSAALIGAWFGGFVYPRSYTILDSLWKGTHLSAVLQKSLVEIATVGIFVNTVSMSCRGFLVGRDPEQVGGHVVKEMPAVTLNDARVWMPYNMLAFSVIPPVLRPTTTLMMEATWQTYISLVSNNYHQQQYTNCEPSFTVDESTPQSKTLVSGLDPLNTAS